MSAAMEGRVLPAGMARDKRGRLHLTPAQIAAVNAFIFGTLLTRAPEPLNTYGMRGLTRAQQSESYQCWWRGGDAWQALEQGGTGQLAALCWYQHVHRPGSKEWRPARIIPALVAAAIAAAGGAA